MPKGENLRRAVRWISEMRKEEEDRPLVDLIQRAALTYNLSPKDEEYLRAFYKEKNGESKD
jgi:hypothetical protein